MWVDQVLSGALGTQASSTTGSHDIAEDYREKSDQVLSGALGTQASSTTGSHDIAEDYREKSDQVLSGALDTQASSTTGSQDIAEDYREKSKANILFNSVHWPWRLFSWSFWWEKENFIKMQLCICVWLK